MGEVSTIALSERMSAEAETGALRAPVRSPRRVLLETEVSQRLVRRRLTAPSYKIARRDEAAAISGVDDYLTRRVIITVRSARIHELSG